MENVLLNWLRDDIILGELDITEVLLASEFDIVFVLKPRFDLFLYEKLVIYRILDLLKGLLSLSLKECGEARQNSLDSRSYHKVVNLVVLEEDRDVLEVGNEDQLVELDVYIHLIIVVEP